MLGGHPLDGADRRALPHELGDQIVARLVAQDDLRHGRRVGVGAGDVDPATLRHAEGVIQGLSRLEVSIASRSVVADWLAGASGGRGSMPVTDHDGDQGGEDDQDRNGGGADGHDQVDGAGWPHPGPMVTTRPSTTNTTATTSAVGRRFVGRGPPSSTR